MAELVSLLAISRICALPYHRGGRRRLTAAAVPFLRPLTQLFRRQLQHEEEAATD